MAASSSSFVPTPLAHADNQGSGQPRRVPLHIYIHKKRFYEIKHFLCTVTKVLCVFHHFSRLPTTKVGTLLAAFLWCNLMWRGHISAVVAR
ncbi:hypothetical protein TNCV_3188911 [Trichonephila clavipes]|nr:hypothetical protein TNCV_3188911 [Trichonephila clavipes]